jgi:hypothetical protein
MYTVTNTSNERRRPNTVRSNVSFDPSMWKVCEHCKTLYKAMYGYSQHCYFCSACGHYKPFADMVGKARYLGYICQECYATKDYVRKLNYTWRFRS